MQTGDLVTVKPKSTRYPDLNRIAGKPGHIVGVYRGELDVLVEGRIYNLNQDDVAPGGELCPTCQGERVVPRKGAWALIPGRQHKPCPDCNDQV